MLRNIWDDPATRRSVASLLGLALAIALLAGCGGDSREIKLGFLGGISGRVADLGIGGRNGVTLAIEQANQAGGIKGRPLRLLVRDDRQDVATARAKVRELISAKVAAILGPMTSGMAIAVKPLTDEAKLLLMGITTTSKRLSALDDYFVRAVGSTEYHARRSAQLLGRRGLLSFTVAIDTRNAAYTRSWLEDFKAAMKENGGDVIGVVEFESGADVDFSAVARQLLENQPQGVAIAANSLDAALLATQIRKRDAKVALVGSEWSATERLIALGGQAVDGMITAQYFDRYSQAPKYLAFRKAYVDRFGVDPGFPSVLGYNAARIVIRALREQRDGEDLKQTVLRIGRFDGLQAPIVLDRFGDTRSGNHATEIRDRSYRVVTD